jgi:hypothetical protein
MMALLNLFGAATAGPATVLRLKALLVAALAMLAACLALTVWALIERSGRQSCEIENVQLEIQVQVLGVAIERQNAGVDAVNKAGVAVQAGVKQLLAAADRANAGRASLLGDIREVLNRPTPTRADGKPAGCEDAWLEIEKRVQK